MNSDEIEQELILGFPATHRARVAERLIGSSDGDAEVEGVWITEVRRRDEELKSGIVEVR